MDRTAKLQELKDQQARWMRERQLEIERQLVVDEMTTDRGSQGQGSGSAQGVTHRLPAAPGPPSQGQPQPTQLREQYISPYMTNNTSSSLLPAEQVIDKLTERITDRLRTELKVELQKETEGMAVRAASHAVQQDAFLAKELETQNTCPICYELMVPPERAPHMLFPCGHTFCAACATVHIETHKRNLCPVCRKKIESRALNYSLQQLILNWAARKKVTGNGSTSGPASLLQPAVAEVEDAGAGQAGSGDADEIRRRHERVGLRLRVLKNELLDIMSEEDGLGTQQAASAAVAAHLADQEQEVLARLAAVQAELDLVRQQQANQVAKHHQMAQQASRLSASRSLLVATITPLEDEHAKLQLLVDGLREQGHMHLPG